MHLVHSALAHIRNIASYQSIRGPAFWIATVLIALLLPSPIAAPVLLARLRRPTEPE
jgi:hypothetical protein